MTTRARSCRRSFNSGPGRGPRPDSRAAVRQGDSAQPRPGLCGVYLAPSGADSAGCAAVGRCRCKRVGHGAWRRGGVAQTNRKDSWSRRVARSWGQARRGMLHMAEAEAEGRRTRDLGRAGGLVACCHAATQFRDFNAPNIQF